MRTVFCILPIEPARAFASTELEYRILSWFDNYQYTRVRASHPGSILFRRVESLEDSCIALIFRKTHVRLRRDEEPVVRYVPGPALETVGSFQRQPGSTLTSVGSPAV